MQKTIFILLGAALIAAGAWVLIRDTDADPTDDALTVRGYVVAVEDVRILIAEGLAPGVSLYTGNVEELEGAAYWFTIDEQTRIENAAGNPIRFDSLQLRDEVEVVVNGVVGESYPAQGTAGRIRLTGETLAQEEVRVAGYLIAREDQRILVAEGLAPGVSEYTGNVEELSGTAVWFTLVDATPIVDQTGQMLRFDALVVGSGIEVYTIDPLRLSYPAQGSAERIVLTGEMYEPQIAESFEQAGNLTRNNPGFAPDVWFLNYEAPGQPGLTQSLLFDEQSRCVNGATDEVCDPDTLEQGARVNIEGEMTEDGVRVRTLTFVGPMRG